ncbi:MAG: hypothetical protein JWQ94_91 [Tardiphaga sp.]|nr:hypothetical protein [Tardiphaga sp.]
MTSVHVPLSSLRATIARMERDLKFLKDLVNGGDEIEPDHALPPDLIDIGRAAQLARRAPDTVRSWARKHPYGRPGGYGVKIGARWSISRAPFLRAIGK